jgi:hypothetical protein
MADKDTKATPLGQPQPAAPRPPHPAPGMYPPGFAPPPPAAPGARPLGQVDEHAAEENRQKNPRAIPYEKLVTRPAGYTPPPERPAARQGEAVTPYAGEVVATPPSSPPHLGGKQVNVLMGPYRGNALIMPEAEADQAIADHWASEVQHTFDAAAEPPHDPLTDAERDAAYAAALAWAEAVNPPPEVEPVEPVEEPAPEGETEDARRAREKRNADARADYERRKAEHDRRKADDKALHPADKPPGPRRHDRPRGRDHGQSCGR